MTNNDYTALLNQLSDLKRTSPRLSEDQNFSASIKAASLVTASSLPQDEKAVLTTAISSQANPTGYYYKGSGIQAAIEILDEPVSFAEAA